MTRLAKSTWQPESSIPRLCSGQMSPLSTISIIKHFIEEQDTEYSEWSSLKVYDLCSSRRRNDKTNNKDINVRLTEPADVVEPGTVNISKVSSKPHWTANPAETVFYELHQPKGKTKQSSLLKKKAKDRRRNSQRIEGAKLPHKILPSNATENPNKPPEISESNKICPKGAVNDTKNEMSHTHLLAELPKQSESRVNSSKYLSSRESRVSNSARSMLDNLATLCPCVTPVSLVEMPISRQESGKEKTYINDQEFQVKVDSKLKKKHSVLLNANLDTFQYFSDEGNASRFNIKRDEQELPPNDVFPGNRAEAGVYERLPFLTYDYETVARKACNRKQTKHPLYGRINRRNDNNNFSARHYTGEGSIQRFNEASPLIRGFQNRYPKAPVSMRFLTNQMNHRKLLRRLYGNRMPAAMNANFSKLEMRNDRTFEAISQVREAR